MFLIRFQKTKEYILFCGKKEEVVLYWSTSMAKRRVQEYVKYTTEELDTYVKTAGSCVHRINTEMHLSMGPFVLGDFKRSLVSQISREHVGFYDSRLEGMILDVKRIKVLGREATQRADEPRIHVRIKADVYLFKPEKGAFMSGLVKHIGAHQIGVILYRVFSANLKLSFSGNYDDISLNDTVKFRITNYNLQSYFPSLEGELINLEHDTTSTTVARTLVSGNSVFFSSNWIFYEKKDFLLL